MVKPMPEDKKLNEIIRIQKKRNNYVIIDKTFLEDSRLSFKAKGILAYLLSKPDEWKVIVKDLMNHSGDGRNSVYSGLKELQKFGYYEKKPVRDQKGKIVYWESVVYELPIEKFTPDDPKLENKPLDTQLKKDETLDTSQSYPDPCFPHLDNQDLDYPLLENRQRNNNYNSNNNYSNLLSQSLSVASSFKEKRGPDEMTDIKKELSCPNTTSGKQESQNPINHYTTLEQKLKEQIKFYWLIENNPIWKEKIQEILYILLDAVLTQDKYIKINRENKPRDFVREIFFKLDCNDIIYVIEQFSFQKHSIKNKKAYILTCLYNCKMEMNYHYFNIHNIAHL